MLRPYACRVPILHPGVPSTARSLVYRLIACALALSIGDRHTWQAVPAHTRFEYPDASDWESFEAFPTGAAVATEYLERITERALLGVPFFFHQPVWVILRAVESVAPFDIDGFAHTRGGTTELLRYYRQNDRRLAHRGRSSRRSTHVSRQDRVAAMPNP